MGRALPGTVFFFFAAVSVAQPAPRRARRPPAAEALTVAGPFADEASWCATQTGPPDEACHSPYDDDPQGSSCGCSDLTDAPGWRAVTPAGPARRVRLVRVTRDVHDLDPCALLIETARGVYVLPGVATCGEPRIAHDYSITTTFAGVAASAAPGGGARVTVRVREREDRADMSEVGGPAGTSATSVVTVAFTVGADGAVSAASRRPPR